MAKRKWKNGTKRMKSVGREKTEGEKGEKRTRRKGDGERKHRGKKNRAVET